jgi:hypothetical protein
VAVASVAARPVTLLLTLFAAIFQESACLETRHSLGGDCLKDGDCISGVCTQLRCAASPPTTDSRVIPAPADSDASADGPAKSTGDDAGGEVPAESANPVPEDSSADIVPDKEGTRD